MIKKPASPALGCSWIFLPLLVQGWIEAIKASANKIQSAGPKHHFLSEEPNNGHVSGSIVGSNALGCLIQCSDMAVHFLTMCRTVKTYRSPGQFLLSKTAVIQLVTFSLLNIFSWSHHHR